MKIVNDKIEIARGETPTYDVNVIDETGTPYMILENINNPVIEFIVRPSSYIKENDYVFRVYLLYFDIHKFESKEVVAYSYNQWNDSYTPAIGKEKLLHRREITKNQADYAYYENGHWIPYEFKITFPFPYSATSKMDSKIYKYEIVLFGGSLKENPVELSSPIINGEIPINITYKEPILEVTDFKVGGTLSE